jgi:RNA polymerase sigma-70 factor (ECF subfamily)
LANDVGQETLLAALQSVSNFDDKAGVHTIAILKHKIADHWRRSAREASILKFTQTDKDDGETEQDEFFMSNGHWNGGPRVCAGPEAAGIMNDIRALSKERARNNLIKFMLRRARHEWYVSSKLLNLFHAHPLIMGVDLVVTANIII